MSRTWIRLRRGLGIVIPAIALSVSSYWSLVLHWQACVMCWSERLLLLATMLGWTIDVPWFVAFASASGLVVSVSQWWMQLRAVHAAFCSMTAPCDVSYFQWGPFTTAGLATLVFAVLLLLAIDRCAPRPLQSNLLSFPHKAS
ncbi:disulfide bond formation protein B [Alicyclobacillus acidocaldarius]|uniref:disulfide bond formation protein B n=1 Tax=Alicyclobacillus acidocaldarius TaxID=405212 RepID=UPI0005A0BD29|nr:disulfide bond formation protein B [Alicyclobacillus acidocaldarius]